MTAEVYGSHQALINAANVTVGILPNERLDSSSVTLQGNTILISTVASGLQSIRDSVVSTQSALTTAINSTFTALTTAINSTDTAFRNYSSTADSRMNIIRTDTGTIMNNMAFSTGTNFTGQVGIRGSSLTIQGLNAGLSIRGGSVTIDGTFISTTGFRVGGATITTLVDCDTIDTDAGGNLICGSDATGEGGGTGNNQAVNTSTGLLMTDKFSVGGAIFLSSFPFVSVPGKIFNTGVATFNVVSIQGYTIVVSTANDANIIMRIAQSTAGAIGLAPFSYISSSATVISSSDTTNADGGWRWGVENSTSFKMYPRQSYSLHVTSVPSGGAPLAENYGINVNGWWSP